MVIHGLSKIQTELRVLHPYLLNRATLTESSVESWLQCCGEVNMGTGSQFWGEKALESGVN